MLSGSDAAAIATAYGLPRDAALIGPVAWGELGRLLDGQCAITGVHPPEWFEPPDLEELEEGSAFQEAAAEIGVPSPAPVRALGGTTLTDINGTVVRLQAWVDLRERDTDIDPVEVGALVARLHRVPFEGCSLWIRGTSSPSGLTAGTRW
jgi:hypothetical protein